MSFLPGASSSGMSFELANHKTARVPCLKRSWGPQHKIHPTLMLKEPSQADHGLCSSLACAPCVCSACAGQQGASSPSTGATTDECQQWVLGLKLSSLEQQQVLLTAELSLQPLELLFKTRE